MARVIIKRPDGTLNILNPNQDKYDHKGNDPKKKPLLECKPLKELTKSGKKVSEEYECFAIDIDDIDVSDIEHTDQFYCDGHELKKDYGWEKNLMPDYIIKNRHINDLNNSLKTETDPLQAIKIFSEINDIKEKKATNKNTDVFWSELALKSLEKSSKQKPEIKKKLQQKIKELKGG